MVSEGNVKGFIQEFRKGEKKGPEEKGQWQLWWDGGDKAAGT